MLPFTEIWNIGGKSEWTSGKIGNLESFYDHVNFEMSLNIEMKIFNMQLALCV